MIYVFNSQAWLTAMICSTSSAICGAPNCPCRPLISSSARTSSCRCWPISPRPGAPHLHIKLFFFSSSRLCGSLRTIFEMGSNCCASYDDTNLVFVAFQPMSRSLTVSFFGFFQRPDAAHHWQHNDGVGAAQSRQVPRSAYRLHAGPGCWVPAGREPLLERGSTRLAVGQQEIRLSGLQSYQRGTVNLNQIICLLFVPRVVGVHSLFIKFRPKSLWKWI